jgi:NitT/TauT family transport system ATP-binding protein
MKTVIEPVLKVRNLDVNFPGEDGDLETLRDISFSLAAREFLCILGPSGSGKSTLLSVLAGLLPPTSGQVEYLTGKDNRKPMVGLVFQNANLMPWRTVLQNIILPLELQGAGQEKALVQAKELVDLMGLQGFENSWPGDLSGGMAQRVALARAFIQDPDLLLLDEPFGSLDALTRERMSAELLNLWQARRKSVIMVTHSISEALLLADRVLVFTARPARICLEIKVDLPRPRRDEMRYLPHFGRLSQKLRSAIVDTNMP